MAARGISEADARAGRMRMRSGANYGLTGEKMRQCGKGMEADRGEGGFPSRKTLRAPAPTRAREAEIERNGSLDRKTVGGRGGYDTRNVYVGG